MTFTDDLRKSVQEQWDRVVNHRFTNELSSNTIDRNVLLHYLIQDHRFLDSFVILLASMIAHCHSLPDRIPGCQFLAIITSDENTYFERALQHLDTENIRSMVPDAPCTTNFCRLMRQAAASGSLGEMLAVLVVCEWSYMTWGERVAATTVRNDSFVTYEWVDLHSGEAFRGVVAYLRNLLDQEGERMNEEEKEKCKARFVEAVGYEEDFFDYFYKYEEK